MDPGERQLLAAMPLHAITARFGAAGLRARFAIETGNFPAPQRARLDQALAEAARLHAADRRQHEPYLSHLLRVAIRICGPYQVRDADVGCAALLHDSVEDHAAQLSEDGSQAGALAALGARYGARVAGLVGSVTNPVFDPARSLPEQYREHVAASLAACPAARVIKVSDFIDNGGGLSHLSGPAVARLASKYAPLAPVLADLVSRPDTPLSPEVKTRILGQLDRAQERFHEILAGPANPSPPVPGPAARPGASHPGAS